LLFKNKHNTLRERFIQLNTIQKSMTNFENLFTLHENEDKVWSKTISEDADILDILLSLLLGLTGFISSIFILPLGAFLIFLSLLGLGYSLITNDKQTYYITTNRIIKTDKSNNQITEINIQDVVSVQTPLYHTKGDITIHTNGTNEELVIENIKDYHKVRNTIQRLTNN